jgi:CDP-glucose 4,6-dehydratase
MEIVVMKNLFGGIYNGKTIFITGDTGFKGSWLTVWLKKLGANVTGYSLAPSTKPSHFEILSCDYHSVRGDILNSEFLKTTIQRIQPDIIFHLAAQSLVRESYRDPVGTYQTNIIGTLNVLEAARSCKSIKAFVNVTTDKVYENNQSGKPFRENDPFGGYDMYSSSKACSEILTSSYRRSFLEKSELLLASARAGNVIGGGDWSDDRLIPDAMKAASQKKSVVIRFPDSVRPWQHVLEPLTGYLKLGEQLLKQNKNAATGWNFGPQLEDCIAVKDVLAKSSSVWNDVKWIQDDASNPHEATLLMLDSSKAKNELGWKSVWDLDAAISKTISWYKTYYETKKVETESQIEKYCDNLSR